MSVVIEKKKKANEGKSDARINWIFLEEKYIDGILNGEKTTLEAFARAENIDYKYLRNIASKRKWTRKAEEKVLKQQSMVEARMVERSAAALNRTAATLAESESDMRVRHVRIAQSLQAKAYKRLQEMDLKELSARDAIELMKMGILEERRGRGLPDSYVIAEHGHMQISKVGEIFENQIANNNRIRSSVAKAVALLGDRTVEGNAG